MSMHSNVSGLDELPLLCDLSKQLCLYNHRFFTRSSLVSAYSDEFSLTPYDDFIGFLDGDDVIRVDWNGQCFYPCFQFASDLSVYPSISGELAKLRSYGDDWFVTLVILGSSRFSDVLLNLHVVTGNLTFSAFVDELVFNCR